MNRQQRPITDRELRAWLAAGAVDRGVGEGLTFVASEAAARAGKASWILRYRLNGRAKEKVLGRYPELSFKMRGNWRDRTGLRLSAASTWRHPCGEATPVEESPQGVTAPSAIYQIGGRRFEVEARGFADAVAGAHAARQRPRCMCQGEGVEMYVARLGDGYIVKRMPDTGGDHAPDCPSYEPPADFSGLGQVLGSAITEDPTTGETTLKLDFPLTKMPGRSQMPPSGGDSDSVASDGTRLTLRGLLHYLWDQAELTRWHPGFAGKRTWATVRRHLLQAAEHKLARGSPLRTRLYVPEPFALDQRDAINARRLAHWQLAVAAPARLQQLMLLIGEVKELAPARYGFKAVVKHLPDQAFAIDEHLYRRLGHRFESELALWGAADDIEHTSAPATTR
jgi:hypothetical protein